MARLNEPGASPETLESLKRKFIRQNRDLARVNSTQSLRIGELENEISKLLSENLSLRGQILRLQSDQENRKVSQLGEKTFRLKALLESKLNEISALVGELGQEAQQHKIPPKRRKNRCSSSVQSPKESWKKFYSEKDDMPSSDERLPSIMEDPSYQRRNSEIQDSYNRAFNAEIFSVESPEIGSPPKLQFVDADPVKIDIPTNTENSSTDEPISLDPTLSITVEQRRKKKDSLGSADVKRQNLATAAPEKKEIIGTLRSGAKRKLSVREEEEEEEEEERMVEVNGEKREASNQERKEKSLVDVKSFTTLDEPRREEKNETENQMRKNIKSPSPCTRGSREKQNLTERKALAPKNVNASPRKRNISMGDAKKPISNMTPKVVRTKEQNNENIQHIDVFREPSTEIILETSEIQDETYSQAKLQIPAASNKSSTDVLTLLSTSPLVNKLEVTPRSIDIVPPPSDKSRPSRRVRGSVSYAEPNLRHKMRRPTKKLADAIIRDEFNHSASQSVNLNEVRGDFITPDSNICSFQNETTSPSTLERSRSFSGSGKDDSSSTAHKNIPSAKEGKEKLSSEQTSLTTAQSRSNQNSAKTKKEKIRNDSKSLDCSEKKNENTEKISRIDSDTSSPQSIFSKTKVKENKIDSNLDSIGPSTNSVHKKSAEIVSRRRRRSTLAIRPASTMATESNEEIGLSVSSRHNIVV